MWKLGVISGLIGGILIILAVVLGFVVFPNIVDDKITNEVRLIRGSSTWNKWADIENPVYISFYIHHVTNPDQVEAGGLPVLEERGPYVYKQRRVKVDPHSPTCKETVVYEQKVTYFFDQEKSGNLTEDDVVNIVNIPLTSVMKAVVALLNGMGLPPSMVESLLLALSDALITEQFIKRNVRVGDVTFQGWDVEIYNIPLIAPYLPEEFDGFRFGLWKGKNESTDGVYEVFSGAGKSEDFGIIKKWKGEEYLPYWKTDECNKLRGSDGSMFAPFVKKENSVEIFNSDLCRTLKLNFQEEITVQGINAYRFSPTPDELESPSKNPNNRCYCLRSEAECNEIPSGIIDISVCRNAAPIILSTPHFLDGSEILSQSMGLNPDRVKHATTLDIEPRTGLLLEAHKRIQINLETAPIPQFPQLSKVQRMIFPALWIDESASTCDYDIADFKSRIEKPIRSVNIAKWVVLGIGIGLMVIAILLIAYSVWKNMKSTKETV